MEKPQDRIVSLEEQLKKITDVVAETGCHSFVGIVQFYDRSGGLQWATVAHKAGLLEMSGAAGILKQLSDVEVAFLRSSQLKMRSAPVTKQEEAPVVEPVNFPIN